MFLRHQKLIVAVLLGVVFFLPFFSARNFTAASDEITHLPSGYSYWKTGMTELNPQHPPLVKLMSAAPLLFMDLNFDPHDSVLSGPFKNEWKFGQKFLFSNNADRLLFWGRLPVMLLSVLLGFYIFKWTSEMFRTTEAPHAGLIALFLYAFMPVVIANAQFVTTDLAVTAFSFVTLYYLWKFFGTKRKRHLIYSGIFLGLALGSKFSAVLLFPIISLLFLAHFYFKEGGWDVKINQAAKWFLGLLAVSFAVVYVIYLMPLDISFYLKGMKTVYADWGNNYKFYLNGSFSTDGRWYYFLFAFLIKTPISALIVFVVSLAMLNRSKVATIDKLFVFIPLIVFWFVTSWKAGNISIRYLLPVYPFLILWAGGGLNSIKYQVSSIKGKKLLTTYYLLLTILAGWYVFSALRIYPDYLAYFNEFVGGPQNGYKYLDDSNLEWGHDLKRLAAHQKSYPEMKVLYSWDYSNPDYYGIQNILPKKPESFSNPSGRYAVNTHFLVRLKELSQRFSDKNLDWLSLYQPVDKIGYSFFVYEF